MPEIVPVTNNDEIRVQIFWKNSKHFNNLNVKGTQMEIWKSLYILVFM